MNETKRIITLVLGTLLVLGIVIALATQKNWVGLTVISVVLLVLAAVLVYGRWVKNPVVANDVESKSTPASPVVMTEAVEAAPQDVIVEIIKSKGQARRNDFLKALKMPKTSLGRVLDEMEKQEVIVQKGENKGSFYVLKSLDNI